MRQYNLLLGTGWSCWGRLCVDTLFLTRGTHVGGGGRREKSAVDRILRHLVGSSGRADRVDILGLAERTLSDSESELRSVLVLSDRLLMVGVGARHWGFALSFLGGHDGCL